MSLLGAALHEEILTDHPHGNIRAFALRCVRSKHTAEAGLRRTVAGEGYEDRILSSCLIEGVHRICQEYLVHDLQRLHVTGTDTEYTEGLIRQFHGID